MSHGYRPDLYLQGRKHCSKCGCWRHVFDFYVDASGRGRLLAHCKTCMRVAARERVGRMRRGAPYKPQSRMSPEERRRRKREYSATPLRREYDRIWKEAKRREAGIEPRKFRSRSLPQGRNEFLELPAAPFARWLRKQVGKHGVGRTSALVGLAERNVYGHAKGQFKTVHIDVVDEALIRAGGGIRLADLYPDLYEDKEEAA